MAAKAKKSGRLAIYTRQDKAILFIGYVLLALFVVASPFKTRASPLISANGP